MSKKTKQEFLKIEGMTCANCALGIKKHLDKNGVQNGSVNFASAEASFTKTQEHNLDNVKALIQAIGFKHLGSPLSPILNISHEIHNMNSY